MEWQVISLRYMELRLSKKKSQDYGFEVFISKYENNEYSKTAEEKILYVIL